MSVQAIGTYFDKLIDLQGLKIRSVAKKAKVGENYITRLRNGTTKKPSGEVLRSLTNAIGGSWEHVWILLSPQSSEAMAEALAEACYAEMHHTDAAERQSTKKRLLEVIRPYINDPNQIEDLLGR